MLKGIDVSEFNGVIDWAAVKASGRVDFAIIQRKHPGVRRKRHPRRHISLQLLPEA